MKIKVKEAGSNDDPLNNPPEYPDDFPVSWNEKVLTLWALVEAIIIVLSVTRDWRGLTPTGFVGETIFVAWVVSIMFMQCIRTTNYDRDFIVSKPGLNKVYVAEAKGKFYDRVGEGFEEAYNALDEWVPYGILVCASSFALPTNKFVVAWYKNEGSQYNSPGGGGGPPDIVQ